MLVSVTTRHAWRFRTNQTAIGPGPPTISHQKFHIYESHIVPNPTAPDLRWRTADVCVLRIEPSTLKPKMGCPASCPVPEEFVRPLDRKGIIPELRARQALLGPTCPVVSLVWLEGQGDSCHPRYNCAANKPTRERTRSTKRWTSPECRKRHNGTSPKPVMPKFSSTSLSKNGQGEASKPLQSRQLVGITICLH